MRQIITLIWLVAAIAAQAQSYGTPAANADATLGALKEASQRTSTIQSLFTLEKHTALMQGAQRSNGSFYFVSQGNKLCLDFEQPQGNRIIITDNEFIITAGGRTSKTDMQKHPATAQMRSLITASVTGDFRAFSQRSEIQYFEQGNTFTIVIKPTDRRVRRFMTEIVLQFDTTDNTLSTMQFTDANGDRSKYTYYNKQINQPIDDNIFR